MKNIGVANFIHVLLRFGKNFDEQRFLFLIKKYLMLHLFDNK